MNRKILAATFAAFIAQVIFGFSFMFTKIALEYASPLTVIADRYIAATIGLTAVALVKKINMKSRKIWKVVLMSLFQPVMYFLFESYGIQMTTSAFSSIMISLIPVVCMICGVLFLKEIPSPMQYVFTVISVLGVVIMALVGKADGTVTVLGIVLLFGAVLSSVAYNITSRKIAPEFSAFERTYVQTLTGLVIFLIIALIENHNAPLEVIVHFADIKYISSILYLGIVSSVVAFLMLNYANTYLPVAKTTVFTNFTTVVSVIAGVIFLDEPFSIMTVVSTILIVLGVWGVQMFSVKESI